MLVLLQLLIISSVFLFPIVLAIRYGCQYADGVGLSSEEVKAMNERLNSGHSIDLEIEEMLYVFRRDFNQEILQFRADIQEQYEAASREIASL